MVAAHSMSEFRSRDTARAQGIETEVSQPGDQKCLVASSRGGPKLVLGVGQEAGDIVLGGRGKPNLRQVLTGSPNPVRGAPAQAFDDAVQVSILNIGEATMVEI